MEKSSSVRPSSMAGRHRLNARRHARTRIKINFPDQNLLSLLVLDVETRKRTGPCCCSSVPRFRHCFCRWWTGGAQPPIRSSTSLEEERGGERIYGEARWSTIEPLLFVRAPHLRCRRRWSRIPIRNWTAR